MTLILATIAYGCGGSGKDAQPDEQGNVGLTPDLANLKAYITTGPHASEIAGCVSIENEADSCTLQELPPIGMEYSTPTVDNVLNHLVVSHTWMGDRMRDLLQIMPPDILLMLRSATAIVIDADIRPADYRRATGAIYIDPARNRFYRFFC